jgi:glycosyltransferase involved in cell wall biosynthesis
MCSRPIRVLYLQPAPLFGGAERQTATNVPLLAKFGVDVLPVVGPGQALGDWLRERGVDDFIHTANFPGGWPKPHGLERASLPWRYVACGYRLLAQITELVREHSIDLIYASLPFSWIVGTVAARRLGIPIVWRGGGIEVAAAEKVALYGFTRVYQPDRMICPAQKIRALFGPLVPAPIDVIVNGVDAAQFNPSAGDPDLYPRGNARLVVGLAARLVPQKRVEDFIAVAARVGAARSDVSFLVAGEGSLRAHYESLAREAGADALRFAGYVADMPSFYRTCDVLVLPSRSEGCPNVVLEAMAMRRVVVASDAAVTEDVLSAGRDGLVYPVGDIDALESAILRLADQPGLRHQIAAQGYLRATRDLTADACASQVADVLHAEVRRAAGRAGARGAPAPRPMPAELPVVAEAAPASADGPPSLRPERLGAASRLFPSSFHALAR